jgi:hypothetical protein
LRSISETASGRRIVLSPALLPMLVALIVALSACGHSGNFKNAVEGEPVKVGGLKFTVTFSRYLNPSDNEDSAYLVDQPPSGEGLIWFGVFIEIENETDGPRRVPSMTLTDAEGDPQPAFPSESPYALHFGETVEPHERVPTPDSTAQQGPIEGWVVLFRINEEKASSNRPLTLHIGGGEEEARVTLDL